MIRQYRVGLLAGLLAVAGVQAQEQVAAPPTAAGPGRLLIGRGPGVLDSGQ